jgi:hypothetical protein
MTNIIEKIEKFLISTNVTRRIDTSAAIDFLQITRQEQQEWSIG